MANIKVITVKSIYNYRRLRVFMTNKSIDKILMIEGGI